MSDIKTIKRLRALTNAGLTECKSALKDADGDLFTAATKLLTEEDVLKIEQSVRVRSMAGDSIADPVTEDEQQLVDNLVAHFIGKRTRPMNVGFLYELARLFCTDNQIQAAIKSSPELALSRFQELLDPNGEFPGPQSVKQFKSKKCDATVIEMPTPQSEWESDFIVLQQPVKKLFRSSPARVFAIYKRTQRTDRGVANVEELGIRENDVKSIASWVHGDLIFDLQHLANIAFDPYKQEVTLP